MKAIAKRLRRLEDQFARAERKPRDYFRIVRRRLDRKPGLEGATCRRNLVAGRYCERERGAWHAPRRSRFNRLGTRRMGSELPHRGGGRHALHTNAAALNAGLASNATGPQRRDPHRCLARGVESEGLNPRTRRPETATDIKGHRSTSGARGHMSSEP